MTSTATSAANEATVRQAAGATPTGFMNHLGNGQHQRYDLGQQGQPVTHVPAEHLCVHNSSDNNPNSRFSMFQHQVLSSKTSVLSVQSTAASILLSLDPSVINMVNKEFLQEIPATCQQHWAPFCNTSSPEVFKNERPVRSAIVLNFCPFCAFFLASSFSLPQLVLAGHGVGNFVCLQLNRPWKKTVAQRTLADRSPPLPSDVVAPMVEMRLQTVAVVMVLVKAAVSALESVEAQKFTFGGGRLSFLWARSCLWIGVQLIALGGSNPPFARGPRVRPVIFHSCVQE